MTWEFAIGAVTFLFLLFYAIFVLSALRGLLNLPLSPSSVFQPFVSVVIAARNEQATIAECLNSVLGQDYPSDRIEAILVDDGSTDSSLDIAEEIARRDKRLKVLHAEDKAEATEQRKPQALAMGIHASKGEIILTTDGDCAVPRTWVTSMIRSFDQSTAFVAGPVKEIASTLLISRLSQLEFLGIVGVSAGLISNTTPIICNGANLAFRRTAFDAANGYGNSSFCDDEVLMDRIKERGIGKVRYCGSNEAIVTTQAPTSVRTFWDQRIRWASKRGHYENKWILMKLMGLYCSFVSLLVFSFLSVFVSELFPLSLTFLTAKGIVDWTMLRATAQRLDQKINLLDFFIAELLHVPYIVAAAFAGQFFTMEWKGKQIRA